MAASYGSLSMKKTELLVNVGVIVLGAVVLFFLVKTYRATQSNSQTVQGPSVGDQLPAIAGIDWKSNDRTLILALRKGCHYCEESMPFYRRLAQMSQQKELKVNLVAVFPDNNADVADIVKTQGLSVETVPGVPLKSLKVPGTPTIILADSSGRVIQDWVGQLTDQQEKQLLDTLQKQNPANNSSASASANCDSRTPCGAH
jgi:thioredoxin-related protein